jgi:hypothetical protein
MLNMQDNNMEDQDWNIKEDPLFDKFNKLTTGGLNRSANIDWEDRTSKIDYKASVAKTDYNARTIKTDYKARNEKIDFKKYQLKRLSNIDFEARSKKTSRPISQFDKQGIFIKNWDSGRKAAQELGFKQTNINAVCLGKLKTAYGFIWKFKDN